ncbi:hypothetical protein DL89DRAFT_154556 [Linderina pennispora]|uniref:Uncharacterized protein n=1 Tax=Linderina pennispora TaxID=61395 RepID=A0A1Y1W9X9_9FUNG|nr:uncharacterized protein DL89DRAFT_154556 [Linderina pennispora]ORX70252.1 hypothetical protein DL89DRAFT_154556 [Linderina pennispora]
MEPGLKARVFAVPSGCRWHGPIFIAILNVALSICTAHCSCAICDSLTHLSISLPPSVGRCHSPAPPSACTLPPATAAADGRWPPGPNRKPRPRPATYPNPSGCETQSGTQPRIQPLQKDKSQHGRSSYSQNGDDRVEGRRHWREGSWLAICGEAANNRRTVRYTEQIQTALPRTNQRTTHRYTKERRKCSEEEDGVSWLSESTQSTPARALTHMLLSSHPQNTRCTISLSTWCILVCPPCASREKALCRICTC